jgi:hypothetical protein
VSSDDYIFVLETPSECVCGSDDADFHESGCPVAWGRTEYRVRHVHGAYWDNEDEMVTEFTRPGTPVFYDKGRALIRAHEMAEADDLGHVPEYGVRIIKADQPVLRSNLKIE